MGQKISYVISFILYYLFVLPISWLPMSILYLLSDILYLFIIYVFPYREKLIRKNIHLSFPHESHKERATIKRKFYRHFADLIVEGINNVLPQLDVRGRFFWKKRIFTNKMELLVGADVSSRSSYSAFAYEDRLAIYTIPSIQENVKSVVQFDALFAVNIDEFRFYFKAENLNDYSSQQKVFSVKNYPISPSIFRIGFTWDFVN
ncbi:MAG: hypothetical protein EB100_05725 [Crocinitomicaceae bacterium]|nr:hypothetical protein [Crocinitomicaceae bacterium]